MINQSDSIYRFIGTNPWKEKKQFNSLYSDEISFVPGFILSIFSRYSHDFMVTGVFNCKLN